jgi:hypothetical protein
MVPFYTINDWRWLTKHGLFYSSIFFIKVEFSGVTLFSIGVIPSGRPNECFVSLCLLGFGICWLLHIPIF